MNHPFITKTKRYIELNSLATPADKILVGLSGGADSMALLLLLKELGYNCIAAHCNFHLRGEESQRDEDFCRNICEKLNIDILVNDFDVPAQQSLTGESLEMACRTLRYDWWYALVENGKADLIAVGHHLEDNVETLFINLLRGTGIAGLKGMMPKNGRIIRPLLKSKRSEIENYLNFIGIEFVTDSTNHEIEYQRNKLRNILIPQIELSFPGATDSIGKTIDYLQGNYELYTDYTDILRKKYVINDKGINVSKLVTNEPHAKMALFELIRPMGYNMTHVCNILNAFDDNGKCEVSGKYFTNSQSITLLLDRGLLKASEISNPTETMEDINFHDTSSCNGLFTTSIITMQEFETLKTYHNLSPKALYLDAIILETDHKFSLRNWRQGDRIKPFGMNGSKLLSDIFSDAKLSVEQKRKVQILTCDDEIIWVIGLRSSRYFSVTDKTKNVLVINYNKP